MRRNIFERIGLCILTFFIVNVFSFATLMNSYYIIIPACIAFILINIAPSFRKGTSKRNRMLTNGVELLILFVVSTILSTLYTVWLWFNLHSQNVTAFWINCLIVVIGEAVLFWNGIIRVYLTSVQLGIKWRIIGIACGMIPIVNLVALYKIISIVMKEIQFENQKYNINIGRAEKMECKTKYPLLLVHGVFFRDSRYLNYWGRIPSELIKNGATVYYGVQDSAASVKECGKEIAERIKEIVKETGCEKVNIIAHSKGGLDSRYAISCLDVAAFVASLTTINTPHRGCIFADYLLNKLPESFCQSIARKYNRTLLKLGDKNPDFMTAVKDLTASECSKFNETAPDIPHVFYQSVGSKMKRATSGKFPLNVSYPLVRHFDGESDGLVAVESMKWGEQFTFVKANGCRGISHGDMIDLNRENIPGFDVREFYFNIVKDLKNRGL